MRVLISTSLNDSHALAVNWALNQLGHESHLFYPFDLVDGATWSYSTITNTLNVNYKETLESVHLDDLDVVWVRRFPRAIPMHSISDSLERATAEAETDRMVAGMIQLFEAESFAVNSFQASFAAENKNLQLGWARKVGFEVPATIVSNSISEIERFFGVGYGQIVYKPLDLMCWTNDQGHKQVAKTTLISDLKIFDDVDVQTSPAIYQRLVQKKVEIRVTIMGRSVFAWSICPKSTDDNVVVDWRFLGKERLKYLKHELPPEIENLCFSLMSKLNLVFASFDLAINEKNEYVFFEINANGQFLWGEDIGVGHSLLDAFVRFIESRDPLFQYVPDGQILSLVDYFADEKAQFEQRNQSEAHFNKGNAKYTKISLRY